MTNLCWNALLPFENLLKYHQEFQIHEYQVSSFLALYSDLQKKINFRNLQKHTTNSN